MYKITAELAQAVLNLIGTRTQGTFAELQPIIDALQKLEKIAEEVKEVKATPEVAE